MVSLYSFYPFRRVDDSLEFYNNTWQQYKVGFNNGIENGNLWLGNDRIHVMSSRSNVTLRIEINGDRNQIIQIQIFISTAHTIFR